MNRRLFKIGDKIRIEGDTYFDDYNIRVDTNGEILMNETPGETQLLCRLDEVDNDHNVNAYVDIEDLIRCNPELIKQEKRPGWDEYFLNIAAAVGKRSTCLRRKYGAIIVKNKIIISTGYNGAPRGEANCIDIGECERQRLNIPSGQNYELCVAVHAEQNAIINADPVKMQGATIYIEGYNADGSLASGKPCLLCRRMIRNAMIAEIVFRDTDGRIRIQDMAI